jgi:uncharacterized membrane protein YvbJ
MKFSNLITKFRNNEPLPEKKLTGGKSSDISIFKNYLIDKKAQTKLYSMIYLAVLLLLIVFSVVTVIVRDDLSDSFKYIISGEGATVLVFVLLLNGAVKIQQNAMDLLFLINYFKDQPEEQKKVLDSLIDDFKKRRRSFR